MNREELEQINLIKKPEYLVRLITSCTQKGSTHRVHFSRLELLFEYF